MSLILNYCLGEHLEEPVTSQSLDEDMLNKLQ